MKGYYSLLYRAVYYSDSKYVEKQKKNKNKSKEKNL